MSFQTTPRAASRRLLALIPAVLVAAIGLAFSATALGAPNITTAAGTVPGYGGDDGPATSARLGGPRDITVLADGSYLIADPDNDRIRRVSPSGVITTIAGIGTAGLSGDGGPAVAAQFNAPSKAVPYGGGLLVADWGNHRIRFIDANGIVTTVAGTTLGFSGDGGPALAAQFDNPRDIAPLPGGGYLVADESNNVVRKVDAAGIVTTVAGTIAGFAGDDGPATAAKLNGPRALALTADGSYLIADSENHRVRRVAPTGVITTVAGTAGPPGFGGDGGPATAAVLNFPRGVSVTPDGGFLIADTGNNRVRLVSPAGVISTVAGSGVAGVAGDGGPATSASLTLPRAAVPAPGGGVLIADTGNARVRYVEPPPIVVTGPPPAPFRIHFSTPRRAVMGGKLKVTVRASGVPKKQGVTLQEHRTGRWRPVRVVLLKAGLARVTLRLDRRAVHVYRVAYNVGTHKGVTSRRTVRSVPRLR